MSSSNCTLNRFEEEFAGRHLIHDVVRHWAKEEPDSLAFINANRKQEVDWATFDRITDLAAMQLVGLGFRRGDIFATSLPFLTEHLYLEYACFKIGVIHAPLDLRLKPAEVIRCLNLIGAKGYAFPGTARGIDFGELGRAAKAHCPTIRTLVQFTAPAETIEDAVSFAELAAAAPSDELRAAFSNATAAVDENDGAQVIFTTGSTGAPKGALLSHRNITCQNMCLGAAFGFGENTRLLVNLPPSHVGGQAEALMTTLFWGGTAVLLEVFDATRSVEAVQTHRVNMLGQIPAMYQFEWRLSDYGKYDLSSLEFVIYGGQQVPMQFLERLAAMSPKIGTGLGLTEAAGFCTYTHLDTSPAEIIESIGHEMPVYPMSIRQLMREDGSAGDELRDGEMGQICFRGPQTFLGYVNDPAATAKAISADGYLYSGDMGFRDAKGLHFAGRSKWVIKPGGYQVFPAEVENHLCAYSKIAACGVVGMEHSVFTEAIVAFVEKKSGADLTTREIKEHARAMTSYMRPLHYVILEPGQMPLNRAVKTDYLRLQEMAREEIERLRAARRWDR